MGWATVSITQLRMLHPANLNMGGSPGASGTESCFALRSLTCTRRDLRNHDSDLDEDRDAWLMVKGSPFHPA